MPGWLKIPCTGKFQYTRRPYIGLRPISTILHRMFSVTNRINGWTKRKAKHYAYIWIGLCAQFHRLTWSNFFDRGHQFSERSYRGTYDQRTRSEIEHRRLDESTQETGPVVANSLTALLLIVYTASVAGSTELHRSLYSRVMRWSDESSRRPRSARFWNLYSHNENI